MEDSKDYKDKKGLLTFFGILLLLMGILSLLIFLVSAVTISAMPETVQHSEQVSMSSATAGLVIYLIAAALFITLGIGSIKTTRWARSLILILSWYTLIIGIFVLLFFIFWGSGLFDQLFSNASNTSVAFFATIFLYSFLIFFFIILPGIFILIYQREDVIKTVEHYDAKVRWTDKCPIALLALSILFLYTSITPFFYFAYGFVAPFFGIFLTEWPAAILWFVNSIVCIYLAIEIYKMKIQAWHFALYLSLFWIISLFITLFFNDFLEIYRHMNMPADQLALLESIGILSGARLFSMMLMYIIPYLVFLLYTRRYFIK